MLFLIQILLLHHLQQSLQQVSDHEIDTLPVHGLQLVREVLALQLLHVIYEIIYGDEDVMASILSEQVLLLIGSDHVPQAIMYLVIVSGMD